MGSLKKRGKKSTMGWQDNSTKKNSAWNNESVLLERYHDQMSIIMVDLEAMGKRVHKLEKGEKIVKWREKRRLKSVGLAVFASLFFAVYCIYWKLAVDAVQVANCINSWSDKWLLTSLSQMIALPILFLAGFFIGITSKGVEGTLYHDFKPTTLTLLAVGCFVQVIGQLVAVLRFQLFSHCMLTGPVGELMAVGGVLHVTNCALAMYNIKKFVGSVDKKDAKLLIG